MTYVREKQENPFNNPEQRNCFLKKEKKVFLTIWGSFGLPPFYYSRAFVYLKSVFEVLFFFQKMVCILLYLIIA